MGMFLRTDIGCGRLLFVMLCCEARLSKNRIIIYDDDDDDR